MARKIGLTGAKLHCVYRERSDTGGEEHDRWVEGSRTVSPVGNICRKVIRGIFFLTPSTCWGTTNIREHWSCLKKHKKQIVCWPWKRRDATLGRQTRNCIAQNAALFPYTRNPTSGRADRETACGPCQDDVIKCCWPGIWRKGKNTKRTLSVIHAVIGISHGMPSKHREWPPNAFLTESGQRLVENDQ